MNESAYHELHEINTDMATLKERLRQSERQGSPWVKVAVLQVAAALDALDAALRE